ncbi:hypothetical protein K7432_003168 [Basidiobolus ranarum]|uniref:Uncharacterized protein n=1 Tax=Basidiobolus ranarum TaxID=34480 RepID=A0ABR2X0A4_9FUNG
MMALRSSRTLQFSLRILCQEQTKHQSPRLGNATREPDLRNIKYELYRIDTHGVEYVMKYFDSITEAQAEAERYSELGHKQGYFVREKLKSY